MGVLFQGLPVFFIQERIGRNQHPFYVYKLRTMKDHKITFWGRIIRKFGIDELPQLINIVKGEMAFIGPRPLTQADILRLGWNTAYYSKRWNALPGITGMAQSAGGACHKKITWFWDRYYVMHKSPLLDMGILVKSLGIVLFGKGDRR